MDAKIIPDSIRDVLDYNPETGVFTWKIRPHIRSRPRAGDRAGWPHATGYRCITVSKRNYLEHRLAWFLYHGEQPPKIIDHVNRKKRDNRIANLRGVTTSQNGLNQGPRGVTWVFSRTRKYARAQYRGRHLYTGPSLLVAHYRRIMAERADHPIGLPAPDAGH